MECNTEPEAYALGRTPGWQDYFPGDSHTPRAVTTNNCICKISKIIKQTAGGREPLLLMERGRGGGAVGFYIPEADPSPCEKRD